MTQQSDFLAGFPSPLHDLLGRTLGGLLDLDQLLGRMPRHMLPSSLPVPHGACTDTALCGRFGDRQVQRFAHRPKLSGG